MACVPVLWRLTNARLPAPAQNLEQSALVPPWLRVLCPNATSLATDSCNVTEHLPAQSLLPSASAAGGPTLMPHQHLAQVEWLNDNMSVSPHLPAHLWRQLASLPSLRKLDIGLAGTLAPALHHGAALAAAAAAQPQSSSTTTATATQQLLPLTSLNAVAIVNDDFTDAVLQHLPQLEHVYVQGFRLRRSHVHHQQCNWGQLRTAEVDVDSFARLPLERVRTCTWTRLRPSVRPSRDAQAVARVAAAVQRWGPQSVAADGTLGVSGADHQALLTTLPPLLAALAPTRESHLKGVMLSESAPLTPEKLGEVARLLPPSVTRLSLGKCQVPADAWGGLLAALPAHVEEMGLWGYSEEHVLALCRGAVRPVRVCVLKLSEEARARVHARLVEEAAASGGGSRAAVAQLVPWPS